jgi:osmotically-inducible protein OsmY
MGRSLAWRTDTQLHDSVRLQLDEDPAIRARDIAVVASDGVITLTGFVDSYAEKIAAEQAVKRVRGVRGVANDIEVKLQDERTDPEIAKDAIRSLESHTNVPNRVTVTVRHGLVTLEGTVEWMYQKDAAESAVAYLKGVRGVSNWIRIAQTATTVAVRARIEEALERNAAVHASKVRVDSLDGTVTLSGDVPSWAERQEVERAAWSSPGVTRVINQLTVAP